MHPWKSQTLCMLSFMRMDLDGGRCCHRNGGRSLDGHRRTSDADIREHALGIITEALDDHLGFQLRQVFRGKQRRQLLSDNGYQTGVHIRPNVRRFQIRVHPRKR